MERTIDKIRNYIVNNELEMKKIIKNYNNYISTIIHKSHFTFSKDDEEEIYGVKVSPDMVTAITDKIIPEIQEWRQR